MNDLFCFQIIQPTCHFYYFFFLLMPYIEIYFLVQIPGPLNSVLYFHFTDDELMPPIRSSEAAISSEILKSLFLSNLNNSTKISITSSSVSLRGLRTSQRLLFLLLSNVDAVMLLKRALINGRSPVRMPRATTYYLIKQKMLIVKYVHPSSP